MINKNILETEDLLEQINEELAQGTFNLQDSQLLQQMVQALADKRGMIRLGFVEAFGKIGQPAVPFLLEALKNHPNPVVRRSAAKGMAKIHDPQAIPALIHALLKDEDRVVNSSAAGALARMGAAAVPALLEIIAGDYPETAKGHATWAVSFIGAEATEQLYEAFKSNIVDIRVTVVSALANIVAEHGKERCGQVFMEALEDEAMEVRFEAIAALSHLPPQFALPHLIPLLENSNSELVRAAILSLGKLGADEALPHLRAHEEGEMAPIAKIAISQIESVSEGG